MTAASPEASVGRWRRDLDEASAELLATRLGGTTRRFEFDI